MELYHKPLLSDTFITCSSFLISHNRLAIHAHKSIHTHTKDQGERSMGKDWTKEELQQASKAMMASGLMAYEEVRR